MKNHERTGKHLNAMWMSISKGKNVSYVCVIHQFHRMTRYHCIQFCILKMYCYIPLLKNKHSSETAVNK